MPAPSRTAPEDPYGGLPPHSIFAETWLLAGVLLGGRDVLDTVRPLVRAGDFFNEANGHIFAAALAVAERGESPHIVTIAHELDRTGLLEEVGAEPYLVRIGNLALAGAGFHADAASIVHALAQRRRQISEAGELARRAYAGEGSNEGLLARYAGGLE